MSLSFPPCKVKGQAKLVISYQSDWVNPRALNHVVSQCSPISYPVGMF